MSDESAPRDSLQLTTMHVRRAIGGDVESVAWLVKRLTPLLRAQALYRLGRGLARRHEPEDLVQEAWLRTLPRLGDLLPRDGRHTPVLLRYLSTVILNQTNTLKRKHLREAGAAPVADGPVPSVSALPAETSGVVSRVMRHEHVDSMQDCLAELEDADRELIVLRGIEQLPVQEVATLLDISPAAASMRYSRALAKLRARLPGSAFDEL